MFKGKFQQLLCAARFLSSILLHLGIKGCTAQQKGLRFESSETWMDASAVLHPLRGVTAWLSEFQVRSMIHTSTDLFPLLFLLWLLFLFFTHTLQRFILFFSPFLFSFSFFSFWCWFGLIPAHKSQLLPTLKSLWPQSKVSCPAPGVVPFTSAAGPSNGASSLQESAPTCSSPHSWDDH